MVMMLRSIETFDDSLTIAVNRICRVMGTDSVALLRLFTMKIDLKRGTVYIIGILQIPSKMVFIQMDICSWRL